MKIFIRPSSKVYLITYLVFKVRLLEKALGISLIYILFRGKFIKVVEIAKDIIGLLYILFREEAIFI